MSDLTINPGGALLGTRVAVLIESDYYEPEIFYYQRRFAEEGVELHLLTRMWGNDRITFTGHEWKIPLEATESFEGIDLDGYAALIVPSGIVADRLRYTEDVRALPPATQLLQRAFADQRLLKGIICHGMWLVAPAPELVRGRRVTLHNNLLGDARNMGAEYVDADVVVDGDLVTGRTGQHAHLFARTLIDMLAERRAGALAAAGAPGGRP